jgi:hypothetical protein
MADGDNTAVFGDSYRLTGRCQLVPKGDDNAGPAREPEVNEKLFGKGRETWGLWDRESIEGCLFLRSSLWSGLTKDLFIAAPNPNLVPAVLASHTGVPIRHICHEW